MVPVSPAVTGAALMTTNALPNSPAAAVMAQVPLAPDESAIRVLPLMVSML